MKYTGPTDPPSRPGHAMIRVGERERVVIGGHDIGAAVTEVRVFAVPGRAYVELTLRLSEVDITAMGDPEPRIHLNIPDSTRAALIALGWIPPTARSF